MEYYKDPEIEDERWNIRSELLTRRTKKYAIFRDDGDRFLLKKDIAEGKR